MGALEFYVLLSFTVWGYNQSQYRLFCYWVQHCYQKNNRDSDYEHPVLQVVQDIVTCPAYKDGVAHCWGPTCWLHTLLKLGYANVCIIPLDKEVVSTEPLIFGSVFYDANLLNLLVNIVAERFTLNYKRSKVTMVTEDIPLGYHTFAYPYLTV